MQAIVIAMMPFFVVTNMPPLRIFKTDG